MITRKLTYLDKNVYEAALDRVRYVYQECDDVIVAMSGGKDSTVCFHLACLVARELGRLPVRVMWLDQEAEWQATADYMKTIMYSPEVIPYWFQFPWRLTNSLSHTDEYLHCWDPAARDLWLRDQDPISIKENPCAGRTLFEQLAHHLHPHCGVSGKRHVGVLVGMRVVESMLRRLQITSHGAAYKDIKWCRKKMIGNTRTFWPLYDFADRDVWICIARNDLPYNRIYDAFFRYGIARKDMRVSSLIHETAWKSIGHLQEIEPETYDRFCRRIPGVSTFGKAAIDDIVPRTLPAAFAGWREYRDYLLEHLVLPVNRATFIKVWREQDSEDWYKAHVKSIVINDIVNVKGHMTEVLADQGKLPERRARADARAEAKRRAARA